MENKSKYKVAYIHGRPSGHPIHDAYARVIQADFVPVDFMLPWHENPNSSKLKRYFSWLLCALFFPNKKSYSVFFTESVREPLLIMKMLGLIGRKQKLVPLMANETLYFYHTNQYSKTAMWMIKSFLKKSDAIICVGEFQADLAKKIIGENSSIKIKTITNWVFPKNSTVLKSITPNLNSNKILFIGDISANFRVWYKGVDLMLKAFNIAAKKNHSITLEMIGINDELLIEQYMLDISPEIKKRILIKKREPIFSSLETAALYLHCARGEAWGITIMEALEAGVPVICSDLTGAQEVVRQVSPDLVVQTNEVAISEKILWYFSLTLSERLSLSTTGRKVMLNYSEEKSLNKFQKTFQDLLEELNC